MYTKSLNLYDAYIKPSKLAIELPILIGFNLVLVACSYLSITLPFSPVPITGQSFGILLIAMALGRVRGTAIVLAYLLEGAAGLPVFAGGSGGIAKFMGPTGGYLLGFLVSAWVVGYLADKGWDRKFVSSVAAMVIGTAIIFASGLVWLAAFVPSDTLLTMGFTPFLPGALLKIAVASMILPSIWQFLRKNS